MKYHAIVNMSDAIEIARLFRSQGIVWKRKSKGYYWAYDRNNLLDIMLLASGAEPSMVISISTRNVCDTVQMMIIDADKANLPLSNRSKIAIEPMPAPSPFEYDYKLRWGY